MVSVREAESLRNLELPSVYHCRRAPQFAVLPRSTSAAVLPAEEAPAAQACVVPLLPVASGAHGSITVACGRQMCVHRPYQVAVLLLVR